MNDQDKAFGEAMAKAIKGEPLSKADRKAIKEYDELTEIVDKAKAEKG